MPSVACMLLLHKRCSGNKQLTGSYAKSAPMRKTRRQAWSDNIIGPCSTRCEKTA